MTMKSSHVEAVGWKNGRVYRRLVAAMMAFALLFALLPSAPAAAQERVNSLPQVAEYATAQFDVLNTVEIEGERLFQYGQGEVVLPDRVSLWIATEGIDEILYFIQIGTVVYVNDGTGWEVTDTAPPTDTAVGTVNDQLQAIEETASAILLMGQEEVRGILTNHYQVWLDTDELLSDLEDLGIPVEDELREFFENVTIKYDFWIGTQDGVLYQQNSVITLAETTIEDVVIPAISISSLITYYNFNDPNITIEAPI